MLKITHSIQNCFEDNMEDFQFKINILVCVNTVGLLARKQKKKKSQIIHWLN